jgi:site-specific recombinase XerD
MLYGMSIDFFSRWLVAQGRETTVDELNRVAIREWLATLADTHAPGTVRTRYRGLFRFCGWLIAEDEIDDNPMRTLSPPAPRAQPVPGLSDDELAALLKVCQGKTLADRRDEAMVRLLLDCGPRVSELCGLTIEGLDLDGACAW